MWARALLGWALGWVARAWLGTLRLQVETHPSLDRASPEPWVLAFWHGQQFALYGWPRRRSTVALVSRSADGELLSRAFSVLGIDAVRGSTSRGAARGLAAMIRRLRRGQDAAFAVDGPRGPRGRVQPGAWAATRHTGGVLVPMAAACASKWTAWRSWDRFELPRPFSRVAVVLGAPLRAPASASEAVPELGDALACATRRAEDLLQKAGS